MFFINLKLLLGSESQPWRTLDFAIRRLRQIRNTDHPPSESNRATVHMSGDVHYVAATVALDSRDSWLTIKNYRDERVQLSGGAPLNITWSQESEGRGHLLSLIPDCNSLQPFLTKTLKKGKIQFLEL